MNDLTKEEEERAKLLGKNINFITLALLGRPITPELQKELEEKEVAKIGKQILSTL